MFELLNADGMPTASRDRLTDISSLRKHLTEVAAEQCRRSLKTFAMRAWSILVPSPLIWNWHIDCLLDHLSYVSMGEIRFLMVNLPPRLSKTLMVSVIWPAWHWLHEPGEQFLTAGVDDQLARDAAILSRRLINSDWYQNQYPGEIELFDDENTVGMFRNKKGGYRMTASLQGRITGVGGTCFPAGTLVSTPRGPVAIERLVDNFGPVMSWDGQRATPAAQNGFHERDYEGDLIEIRSSDGHVLRCTPDHRIFTINRGLVEAENLKTAETMVRETEPCVRSLRQGILPIASACRENPWREDVLQQGLFRSGYARCKESGREVLGRLAALLSYMPGSNPSSSETLFAAQASDLLQGVLWEVADFTSAWTCRDILPVVRQGNGGEVGEPRYHENLFALLRRGAAREADRRARQWSLDTRGGGDAAARVHGLFKTIDPQARWQLLSALRDLARRVRQTIGCSPHQLHQDRSGAIELGDPLPLLSRGDARQLPGTGAVDRVLVSSITRHPFKGKVYCIGVAEHKRFFANGLLVSNCQILDDPSDAKKVESDAVRHSALAWHDNAWRSRVNNPETAKKVYVGQRTHDMDIFGHVLEQEGKRWCHLILPMEFDPVTRCRTYRNHGDGPLPGNDALIFEDPRKKPQEVLDPKRMSAKTVNIEKAAMSERAWQAQYNQKPTGQGGLILKSHWWRPWVEPEWRPNRGQERPLPRFSEILQIWDTAFEEDEEADFSACTTWGVFSHKEIFWDTELKRQMPGTTRTCLMLLDAFQERFSYPDMRARAIQANAEFSPDYVLIEKKASGHSLIQELKKKHVPVKAVGLAGSAGGKSRRQGDLIARAHEASLMLEKGCIWYPIRPFSYAVRETCSKFPNGDHDDYVSTCVIAWQYARKYSDLQLPDDERDEINPWAWKKRPPIKRYA